MSDAYLEEEEFNTRFNGRIIARALGLVRPYWTWVLGFVVMIGLTSVMDSFFTYQSKRIIDEAILVTNRARLFQLIAINGGIVLAQAITVFGFIFLAGILGHRLQYDIRRQAFNHLQELSFSYYDKTPVGWIMARVTSDSERIAELVTWGLLDITWASLNICTGLAFMLWINWRMALIVLGIVPIMIGLAFWFRTKILKQYREVRKINSKLTGMYNENITGVRVVKALNCEEQNLADFSRESANMFKAGYRAAWLSAMFLPLVQIVSAFGIGGVVWYSGAQMQLGGLTIGGIQAFLSYIGFMIWPIQDLARVYAEMQRSVASAERVFSLLDAQSDIVDRPNAVDPGTMRGAIEFEHVDFWYEREHPVLRDFNLSVREGERIALVGETGGGKSTIVNLVGRFYEPTGGAVRINGRDSTEFTQQAIQSRIGMVLQTPHLFSGTVRENIRYGRLNATDHEVEQAAQLAHAHDFIVELDKGYDQDVGEDGALLSVGQKQLISLARALLANPDIFIMDEATSSVDTLTESRIQMGIEALMQGRTSFIIAHRLSTIKRADRILVIEKGRIIEQGSHGDLIRARGHYYDLYTRQFRKMLEQEYDAFKPEAQPAAAMAA